MNEPRRWLEDPLSPSSLREVLHAAPPAPPLPNDVLSRLGAYAGGLSSTGIAAKGTAATFGKLVALSSSGVAKSVIVVSLMGAAGTAGYAFVGESRGVGTAAATSPPVLSSDAKQAAPWQDGSLSVPMSPVPASAPSPDTVSALESSDDALAPVQSHHDGIAEERAKGLVIRRTNSSHNSVPNGAAAVVDAPSPNDQGARHEIRQARSAASAAFDDTGIADEAKLLEDARAALASSPAAALDLAQRHSSAYPDGQLSAEREFIVIDALLRLGRRSEAEQRAAPRLKQNPESLYTKRLRQLLTDGSR